eukprot:1831433-Rhodomonas_salina.1
MSPTGRLVQGSKKQFWAVEIGSVTVRCHLYCKEGGNGSGREGTTEGEGEGEREREGEVQPEGGNASGDEGATEVEGELRQRITLSSLWRAEQEQPTDHKGTASVGAKRKGQRGAVPPAKAAKKQHTGKEQQTTGKGQRKWPRDETEPDPEEDIPLAQRQKRNILSSAEGEAARAREVAAGRAPASRAVLHYVFRNAFEGAHGAVRIGDSGVGDTSAGWTGQTARIGRASCRGWTGQSCGGGRAGTARGGGGDWDASAGWT